MSTSKHQKSLPPRIKKRLDDGREFNEANRDRYPANEVILNNRKVLDSYAPGKEIVSRKHTQIADIKPSTWQSYLNEHVNKYGPGEIIKDSPTMRERYPGLVGEELDGLPYMEVPVQEKDVPAWALRAAATLGVIIRDVNGRIYELPPEEGKP